MHRTRENDPQLWGLREADWGGLLRAIHPAKTAQNVAADIGAPVRSAENWIEGVSAPSLKWFAAMAAAYGPEVLAAVLPDHLGWLGAARRAARQEALERRQAALAREWDLMERGRR